MVSCPGRITNFEFPPEEIAEAARNGRLLSIEIEFSLFCNYRCPYCYVPDKSVLDSEMSEAEIRDVILQAKDLGAKKIIILGGEPTVYPRILEMIRFIKAQGLQVEMFTNGSKITADFARRLYQDRVRVVLKMNSFDENIQDVLTGKKGSFQAIRKAFDNLRQAGYPSEDAFLAVSTIICRQNIEELPKMWQWLRDQGVAPYFEVITPQGNAKINEWLSVDPARLRTLFAEISDIDRKRYNQTWDPQPPLMGNKCLRHQFSCLVTSRGFVMPCVGVTLPVGNVREQKLRDIIADSEVIQDLRNFRNTIKGPCHTCEKADHCYGCRGSAYQLTGNYLASDPLCWKNIDRQQEIVRLPYPVKGLIPQKSPMRLLDTLLTVGERTAEVQVTVSRDMPYVGADGVLDEAAYMEMMAQAMAALNGFRQMDVTGYTLEGFLLGAKKLEILGVARVGDVLKIVVHKYARYGDFGIIKGTVSRREEVLARGEIKIWGVTGESREEVAMAGNQ